MMANMAIRLEEIICANLDTDQSPWQRFSPPNCGCMPNIYMRKPHAQSGALLISTTTSSSAKKSSKNMSVSEVNLTRHRIAPLVLKNDQN